MNVRKICWSILVGIFVCSIASAARTRVPVGRMVIYRPAPMAAKL